MLELLPIAEIIFTNDILNFSPIYRTHFSLKYPERADIWSQIREATKLQALSGLYEYDDEVLR